MSDFEEFIGRELDVLYVMHFDHLTMCGSAVPLEECPKLAQHRTDGQQGADDLAALRLE